MAKVQATLRAFRVQLCNASHSYTYQEFREQGEQVEDEKRAIYGRVIGMALTLGGSLTERRLYLIIFDN